MAILFTAASHRGAEGGGTLPDLLRVTVEAIVEVLLICAAGYFLGRRGTIDSKVKRALNKLNQNLFTPALLFGKVAFTLSPAKLADLWIVPVGFVILSAASAAIAFAMATLFRLSRSQRAFAIACATFMNSNSLPIALMQSLTVTVDGLRWGPHDNKDAMLGRALSYLVLFSTLGIILRWSYGIKLLSTADEEATKAAADEEGQEETTASPPFKVGRTPSSATVVNVLDEREDEQNHNVGASLLTSEPDGTQRDQGIASEGAGTRVQPASPKKSRFSEGPVTINRPPDLRSLARRGVPARRWTALGSSEDAEHADFFHRSFIAPKRDFKREIQDYRSFPNTPSRTPAASSYASSTAASSDDEDESDYEHGPAGRPGDEHDDDEFLGTGRRARTDPSRTRTQAWLRRNRRRCWEGYKVWVFRPTRKFLKGVQAFMTAPLYAALFSLIVACIRPLQVFLDELMPVRNAIKSAGNCSVPITLLVLGSYFVEESSGDSNKAPTKKSALRRHASTTSSLRQKFSALFSLPRADRKPATGKPGEGRTIFVSVVSRMIVAPLVLIPLLAWWSIVTTNIADDPVFIVTAVLVIGSAPAITLAQMTTAAGNAFERLISKTLFVSYVILTFPTTILLVLVGLEIAKKQ